MVRPLHHGLICRRSLSGGPQFYRVAAKKSGRTLFGQYAWRTTGSKERWKPLRHKVLLSITAKGGQRLSVVPPFAVFVAISKALPFDASPALSAADSRASSVAESPRSSSWSQQAYPGSSWCVLQRNARSHLPYSPINILINSTAVMVIAIGRAEARWSRNWQQLGLRSRRGANRERRYVANSFLRPDRPDVAYL